MRNFDYASIFYHCFQYSLGLMSSTFPLALRSSSVVLFPTYRWPRKVKEVYSFKWGVKFPQCPRCKTTMEREYQLFCNRCGQRLNWRVFDDCKVKYIGWDGVEEDEDDEQVIPHDSSIS